LSHLVTVALSAALWILPAAAQTKGSVEGQVVNFKTGAALEGATVTLTGPFTERVLVPYCCPKTPPRVGAITDSRGGFALHNVVPGNYSLTASHAGYVTGIYGRAGAGQEWLSVGGDRQMKNIVIKLTPRGVIAGTVVDEAGQPLQNARITLYQRAYGAWVRYGGSGGESFTYTNDLGEYRVFDVLPGQYVVSAAYPYAAARLEAQATPGLGHKTTYYPDSSSPDGAQPVAVASGETVKVGFTLRKGPVFRIRGIVAGADETLRGQTCVGIVPEGSRPSGSLMVGSIGAGVQSGSFEIVAVPPGRYTLTANCAGAGNQRAGGMKALDVAGDMEGVTVATTPARPVRGTVRVRGGANLHGAIVVLQSVEPFGGPLLSAPLPNRGAFTLENALPWRYVPEIRRLPPNCYIQSIRYGGMEVTAKGFQPRADASLEIAVSTLGAARLRGAVVDSAGRPVKYPMVTVIPSGGAPAASATYVIGDAGGRFAFRALRPGRYRAAAWGELVSVPLMAAGDSPLLNLFIKKARTVRLATGTPRAVRLTSIAAEEASRARSGQ
jgi:hypothetical protein